MRTLRVRLLADDLTGALDAAAAFAGPVPVHLDAPPGGDDAPRAVVATATRDVPADRLPALLAPSLAWLRAADLPFKKVDSLLRGNTYAECAHVARAGGFRRIVFAPAFPAQGRVVEDGRAWRIAPHSTRREPIDTLPPRERFAALGRADDAATTWIPDVHDDGDLVRVAAASHDPHAHDWLWCGSAGLAHALATAHGLAPVEGEPPAAERVDGRVLVLSASRHPVLRAQWQRVGGTRVDAGTIAVSGAGTPGRGVVLVDLASAGELAADAASRALADALAALLAAVARPSALVVVGGDTLLAVCRASGTRALAAHPGVQRGWGRAALIGGCWDGLVCHTRSGAFGDDDDLARRLEALAPLEKEGKR